jgi:hypothetical protein
MPAKVVALLTRIPPQFDSDGRTATPDTDSREAATRRKARPCSQTP